MSPKAILPLLETWIELYNSFQNSKFSYVSIFENKAIGSSNLHPHCQVWATSYIPHQMKTELDSLAKYRGIHSSCMLCDYVELEGQKKDRIVVQKGIWIALCPYWAIWPFEILLLPKSHVDALPSLSPEALMDLAEILASITIRFDNLFETSFPYSMGIHQAPIKLEEGGLFTDISHLHFHFYPPLLRSATVKKSIVGYRYLPHNKITVDSISWTNRNESSPRNTLLGC
jgi:UDPglucose--hexose-1-phosphate uridylyltransferase